MKKIMMLSALLGLLASCDTTTTPRDNKIDKANSANSSKVFSADNNSVQARNRSNDSLTPIAQPEANRDIEADNTLTQKVQRVLNEDPALSNAVKNIKVITVKGKVILRGPVTSEKQKDLIIEKIKAIQGVESINNQLEVAKGSEE